MSIPSTFGDFWPEGQFESLDLNGRGNWDDRLDRYYQSLPSEAQKVLFDYGHSPDLNVTDYQFYVAMKFSEEIGNKSIRLPTLPPLNSIKPHEPPQSFLTVRGYKSLAALISLNGLLAVNETLKEIIERFEPGMHQFFPIEIRMPRGRPYHEQYYVLVIGQYIDSFDPEKTTKGSWSPRISDRFTFDDSKNGIAGLALSKAVFGSAHLWRERRSIAPLICFSDALETSIVEAGLRLPKHYRMMEV